MHGLSEALRSSYLEPSQIDIRPNSIGKAIPDVYAYVINEKGKECSLMKLESWFIEGALILLTGYWEETNLEEDDYRV